MRIANVITLNLPGSNPWPIPGVVRNGVRGYEKPLVTMQCPTAGEYSAVRSTIQSTVKQPAKGIPWLSYGSWGVSINSTVGFGYVY